MKTLKIAFIISILLPVFLLAQPAKDLSLGNIFSYRVDDNYDISQYNLTVIADTIINNKQYAVLRNEANGEYIFEYSDSLALYSIIDGVEKLIYRLDWQVGSQVCSGTSCYYTVTFNDTATVLDTTLQQIGIFTGDSFSGHSLNFSQKFGMTGYYGHADQMLFFDTLIGAKIRGRIYGDSSSVQNQSPYFTSVPDTFAFKNMQYDQLLQANDPDNDRLYFSIISAPSWLYIFEPNRLMSTSAMPDSNARYSIQLKVDDHKGGGDILTFFLHVYSSDPPHIISTPDTIAHMGVQYTYQIQVDYQAPQFLAYFMFGADWLTVDPASGLVSGTPALSDTSEYDVGVCAGNNIFLSEDCQNFPLHVVNEPSVIGGDKNPTTLILFQNYPNPFNSSTTISFSLNKAVKVQLTVFNLSGQVIRRLLDQVMQPKYYSIPWVSSSLPSGIYFYELRAGDYVSRKRMLLIK